MKPLFALLPVLLLSACGGGATSGSQAPPSSAAPPPAPAQPARLHAAVIAGAAHQNNGGDFADGNGATARFSNITGLAADKAGNVFVADSGNCAIRKITPAGSVTLLAGSGKCEGFDDATVQADGSGQQARFYLLGRITIDAGGNLYVNDRAALRRITPAGSVTTLAGILRPADPAVDGMGTGARFLGILDLSAAPDGSLTVADYTHGAAGPSPAQLCTVPNGYNTLREVSPAGQVTTLPGSNADCDASKAAANPLTQASSVRYDKAGNLWLLHLQTLARRAAGSTGALIVKDANGQPIANGTPGAEMEIAPDDFGNLYYRIGGSIVKLDANGVKTEVLATRADAPVDLKPDLALDAMRNFTYIGNHDFLVSVNNQVVKLTLK